jgi:hypothetical protein
MMIRTRSQAAALLTALGLVGASCTPADPSEVVSDGGTWSVRLLDGERIVGWNELELDVAAVEGGAAPEGVAADVWMPAMGHGSTEDVAIEDAGDGAFVVSAFLQMAGAWELSGDVAPGGEAWTLAFEVIGD